MGNIKLLKEVRDNIVMNPDKHNQKTWVCGTRMCIAGHAAVMSGKAKVAHSIDWGDYFVDQYGDDVSPSSVAQDELSLSPEEYEYLFFCMDNEIAIKRMDQVIQLWEDGKVLENLPYEEWIHDGSEDED